ncbi:response regulator transcription factor (plasmid) [Streptomyces sp. NBC_00490]|uniref:response regulator transcription factor n=1 Tax=Streptomyces sp. NBC_00490 TaxID=2903657 RepID=UPI002E1843C4
MTHPSATLPKSTTTLLLAEPHTGRRARRAALLAAEPDLEVMATCSDEAEVHTQLERRIPDVVLTDPRLPGTGPHGTGLIRRLTQGPHRIPVLVLADPEPLHAALETLQAGAHGLLFKDTDDDRLPRAVRLVAGGEAVLSSRITWPLIDACVQRSPLPALDRLTPREREVLALTGAGLSIREIADRLVISHFTARTHVRRTMVKLGARRRAGLVAIAYGAGVVHPRTRQPAP